MTTILIGDYLPDSTVSRIKNAVFAELDTDPEWNGEQVEFGRAPYTRIDGDDHARDTRLLHNVVFKAIFSE